MASWATGTEWTHTVDLSQQPSKPVYHIEDCRILSYIQRIQMLKLKSCHNCSLLAHVSPQFWEIMLVISSWQRRCRTSLLAISFEHFETGLDQSRVNYCFWHAIAILYVTGSSKSSQVSSYVFQSKLDYEISRSLNCPNII